MVSPVPEIELLANEARISALRMTSAARAAHIGSSLSMIDILAAIYCGIANLGTGENDPNRDVVLVSKGHAAAGVYAVMAHVGLIPIDWLERYCQDGAELGGHVTSEDIPWVDFSTGSLGHALPFGLGVALAAKRDGSPRRVLFCSPTVSLTRGVTGRLLCLRRTTRLTTLQFLSTGTTSNHFDRQKTQSALNPSLINGERSAGMSKT